jgi:hypothetical protein
MSGCASTAETVGANWLPEGMLLDVSRKRTPLRASVRAARAVEDSLRERPPAATAVPRRPLPGLDGDCLFAPDGRAYRLADARLNPRRAYELVVAGAVVAFDDCGCDGFCGLAWVDHDELQRLVRHGPPRIRRKGKGFSSLEEWRTDIGDPLVVARGDVRWA